MSTTALTLADALTYTPDSRYPWQVAGAPGRMDAAEARVHLAVLHQAADRTAEAALALARVRDTAQAIEHLDVDVACAQVRLVPGGRWMSRTEALQVLQAAYRLTREEAEARLAAGTRAGDERITD